MVVKDIFWGGSQLKKIYGDVVLVTGASSGIGKATAEYLSKQGFKVYGTSRKASFDNQEVYCSGSGFLKMIPLDVCSEESIKAAVDYIVKKEGTIGILINNAGFGIAGSVEDTTYEEAYSQFDTNFFGMHRMCRAVLPAMRSKRKGLIINISSVAGFIAIPYQSMYSACKYAVEAMTEALRMEVKPFGINTAMVEPGDTKTGFTGSRQYVKASADSPYKDNFIKAIRAMEKDEASGPEPDMVVRAVARIISSSNPPVRITPGFQYKLFALANRLVPSRLKLFVVSKLY